MPVGCGARTVPVPGTIPVSQKETTMTFRTALIAATAAAAIAAPLAASAQSDKARIEIGYLKCTQTASGGNILRATEEFTCVLDSAEPGRADETYAGVITKWGISLSDTDQRTIRWVVLASSTELEPGALAGEYGGVSADVSLGVGVGVKALVGGAQNSITLQPLSVSTQSGIGLAAGVEKLTLVYVEQ
jgi:hypothetical protein